MAEALGAGAAVIQLLEVAISIFKHINKAYKRGQDLPELLQKYEIELKDIQDLAIRVSTEESLKEADVSKQLTKLREHADRLCNFLPKLDPRDKSPLRKFGEQLVRGQSDKKRLDEIMKNLDQAKDNLGLAMSLHQLKMTYKIQSVMEAKPIKRRTTTGGASIVLPTRANTMSTSSDSSSSSTEDEDNDTPSESLSEDSDLEGSGASMLRPAMIRRVKNNTVKRGGFMPNAPCGKTDLWAHMDVVEIEGNTCDGGLMVNYRNEAEDIDRLWKSNRERQREQLLWLNNNGFPLELMMKLLG